MDRHSYHLCPGRKSTIWKALVAVLIDVVIRDDFSLFGIRFGPIMKTITSWTVARVKFRCLRSVFPDEVARSSQRWIRVFRALWADPNSIRHKPPCSCMFLTRAPAQAAFQRDFRFWSTDCAVSMIRERVLRSGRRGSCSPTHPFSFLRHASRPGHHSADCAR